MIEKFRDYLLNIEGLAERTVLDYCNDLSQFTHYAANMGFALTDATSEQLTAYFESNHAVSVGYNRRRMSSLNRFYRYLISHHVITINPMAGVNRPQLTPKLHPNYPIHLISKMLALPDITKPLGLRDRLTLELLYGAGIRIGELSRIKLYDVDIQERLLKVTGKGNKQRIVPFPAPVTPILESYLQIRPVFIKKKQTYADRLMLNKLGNPLNQRNVWQIVKKNAKAVGLGNKFTTHSLRHAYASHLLDSGTDLYMLQSLLGHTDIETTQIYTQLQNERLKAFHKKHHPRA